MNVNCPKFVESQRQKKKERRVKHKARLAKRAKRRDEDRADRAIYWTQYDRLLQQELTKLAEAAKTKARREAP